MKTKIVLALSMMFAVIMMITSSAVNTAAQKANKNKDSKQQPIELKANKGAASRGSEADPNIKKGEMPNDKNERATPPAAKGGTSRGGAAGCEVRLDNSTAWDIKIYVDGSYRGTMTAYDDSHLYVAPGSTSVYARADFTDGTYLYWGPKVYDCGKDEYIYFRMTEK